MTRRTSARIAGFTFLFYIAVAFPSIVLFNRAIRGQGTAAKLAGIAAHATDVRLAIVLTLFSCFSALVLAVTLYRITRDQDPDLAALAFTCRVAEGLVGGVWVVAELGLLWLATAGKEADAPDSAAASALGAFLLKVLEWSPLISGTFFAVGSTLFSYLFLRGRLIPAWLAWLGVVASALLVVLLPAYLVEFMEGPTLNVAWMLMLVFEVTLALRLLIKGVGGAPARSM